MKICKKCGYKKKESCFESQRNVCIDCRKQYKKEDYEKNRDRYLRYSKQYKITNKGKVKKYRERYNKIYYKKNKEKMDIYSKNYKENNKDKIKLQIGMWKKNNKDKIKEYSRKQALRIKMEILNAYSDNNPKCTCCGEDNPLFLSLDHIKNNGSEERREVGATGYNFYYYLKKNGFPQNGYQILCYNCNFGKRFYKDCPHKLSKKELNKIFNIK